MIGFWAQWTLFVVLPILFLVWVAYKDVTAPREVRPLSAPRESETVNWGDCLRMAALGFILSLLLLGGGNALLLLVRVL